MKPLRRVYRIEHGELRCGPWASDCPGYVRFITGPDSSNSVHPSAMPTPWHDLLRRGAGRYMLQNVRHAYPDMPTLLKWWTPHWRMQAHLNGFVIGVYGVGWTSHALYAEQVLFNVADAVKLRDLPIADAEAARVAA